MYRFPQQHHPTSFPKINLPVELMIQTWNHNLMWWYFFFLQNQWDIFPHVPSPRFHNHHHLFLTQSLNCIYHFIASWCIFTFLLYFVFICFQFFCLFICKLEFSIFCFAFHYQCLLHGVLLLHYYVGCH